MIGALAGVWLAGCGSQQEAARASASPPTASEAAQAPADAAFGKAEASPPPSARPQAPAPEPQAAMRGVPTPGAARQTDAAPAEKSLTQLKDGLLPVPPGSLPAEDEELWVIIKHAPVRPDKSRIDTDDSPGSGGMIAHAHDNPAVAVPVPLKHTEVRASLDAYIATVDVTQQFHNPFTSQIEAVYVFPLPDDAAINQFVMTIGERKIRGIIRERDEAERIYEAAKQAGKIASLFTQERSNVFTQKVANIEPGHGIDVSIRYYHTLTCDDGWYEWALPMVVGPRYHDASAAEEPSNVQYLRPNERSGHEVALIVDVRPGFNIHELKSVNHAVERTDHAPNHATVTLSPNDRIPNRDFVLRYRVADDRVRANVLTHRDKDGQGYFTLVVQPPQDLSSQPRQPVELIFVVDGSQSMGGQPMAQSKAAMARALGLLSEKDAFQVIRLSDRASAPGDAPVLATPANVDRARQFIEQLSTEGGAMSIDGLIAALDLPPDPERLRFIVLMTDGYIGDEAKALAAIHEKIGATRIFSFGVGSSPNRGLLNHAAKIGRGAAAYLPHDADGAEVIDRFFERISRPVMTDITIDFSGMQVAHMAPRRVPDLFVGRPIIVTGRFNGEGPGRILVTGRTGPKEFLEIPLRVNGHETDDSHSISALPVICARRAIAQLIDEAVCIPNEALYGEIRSLALDHNLMSAFTAFVAVDSKSQTAGDASTTVPVPVPTPKSLNPRTTVKP